MLQAEILKTEQAVVSNHDFDEDFKVVFRELKKFTKLDLKATRLDRRGGIFYLITIRDK